MARLVDFAERKNVNLAFENLNYLQHLNYILNNIESNKVGFCYDSGHEHWNHLGAKCLQRYGHRLIALHLDDNFGNADTHLLPYDGSIEWKNVTADLKKCRDIPFISLEVDFKVNAPESEIYRGLSADAFLQRAYERACKIRLGI